MSKPLKVYCAGPMRGYYEFNFPAFKAAAARLRAEGHEVFSPAERDEMYGFYPAGMKGTMEELATANFSLREAIAEDVNFILLEADAIYLLKGWSKSSGANLELQAAKFVGLSVLFEEGAERES